MKVPVSAHDRFDEGLLGVQVTPNAVDSGRAQVRGLGRPGDAAGERPPERYPILDVHAGELGGEAARLFLGLLGRVGVLRLIRVCVSPVPSLWLFILPLVRSWDPPGPRHARAGRKEEHRTAAARGSGDGTRRAPGMPGLAGRGALLGRGRLLVLVVCSGRKAAP